MNILLVGEFSRLHNSLKEGLQELGHQVVIVGFGDGFKNYPVDYPIRRRFNTFLFRKTKAAIYKLTGFSVDSWLTYRQFKNMRSQLTGFDVVQLINENSFYCTYRFEKKILQFLFENNKKAFLMCCGSDYLSVKYAFDNPEFKSVVQPYLAGKVTAKEFANVLKFRRGDYRKLHEYIYENVAGIIASDMDYHIPLQHIPKYAGMIPNPINIKKLQSQPLPSIGKVVIFHGINTENYFKKGNDFFEKALQVINQKYGESVEIITTRSVPYKQYIDSYNKAHIVLDMAYAHDQGFNALEAMAKGKVVFTGAEKEFTAFYNLKEKVCINAIADVDYLVSALSALIENPLEIEAIGKRAREFVENEHNYIASAKKYLNTWNDPNVEIHG